MSRELIEVPGFQMAIPDPFLEALISLVAEPNGSSNALHAYETTRDWWEEHGAGPTWDELFGAMFQPRDWGAVVDDPSRPRKEREARVGLLRQWLVYNWARSGAINIGVGLDEVVRPGVWPQAS